jgi:hypothetical protein
MPQRLKAEQARHRVDGHEGALLVCAYDDVEKCAKVGIEESIPYAHLKPQLDSISKSRELIFFCA